MKKILMTLSAIATLGAAVVLSSCNNAEEVKKQTEEQNAKIQAMVDEKLAGLQTEADAECTAMVDTMALALYDAWVATEGKKKGIKPAPKPASKPAAKVEEPKKPETKADKMGGNTSTTNTADDKASKMGGTGSTTNTPTDKSSKMGGTKP